MRYYSCHRNFSPAFFTPRDGAAADRQSFLSASPGDPKMMKEVLIDDGQRSLSVEIDRERKAHLANGDTRPEENSWLDPHSS